MEPAVSLIPPEVTTIITNFATALPATVLALLTIIIPVGLSMWAIGFASKKGLSMLQKKAKSAL